MKKLRPVFTLIGIIVTAVAFIQQFSKPKDQRDWNGKVLFIPYDFRPPTLSRIRERWWNSDDKRLFTPHVFGVGWSVNLYRVLAMMKKPDRAIGETASAHGIGH